MRRTSRVVVPRFLAPGDAVTVVAPSGVVNRQRLGKGVDWLRDQGYRPVLAPHVHARHGYLAGKDALRAADLNQILSSDPSPAILFARGGYGLTRILDSLDLDELRRRPRLMMGYSDVTALFMALQRRGPYAVLYGPTVSELGESEAFDSPSLLNALRGDPAAFAFSFPQRDVLRPGRGLARVIGGCLSLLVALLGTAHDPDYNGAILFWEEIAEPPYRIDRMLTQLRNAGKFDRLEGMIVGSLTDCAPAPGRPTLQVKEVLMELAREAKFPIVGNLRAGHVARKLTLPLGMTASLNTRLGRMTFHPPLSKKLYPARGSRA